MIQYLSGTRSGGASLAWPMDTFVENNDFTGKTVIPFCTSSSSDIGESGQLLADLAEPVIGRKA